MKSIIPAAIADQSWSAIWFLCALAGIGIAALYSVAGGAPTPWAAAHAVRFTMFLVLALVMSYIRPETYKALMFPALGGSALLLILVLLIGTIGGGARSWLNLGFMQVQPSEFAKIALLGVLARYYELLPPGEVRTFRALIPPVLITMVPFMLIVIQPDLGTAMLLLLSVVILCFMAGLPLWWFIGSGMAVMIFIPIAYNFLMMPHQQKRVTIFLNPQDDPLGAGYHISQSFIAIGSGGIWGKGYLQGTQSHLDYLPEQHTDFIFPAIAEEWGLFGAFLIILLFGLLLRWGMGVAQNARSRFEQLFAAGLTCSLFLYISINLMMVTGLAPVVGIPLPLVSYGGSAMLATMLCVGILMSIDRNNRRARHRSDF
ncbi:MAG: rod shape-determining protein RodA [Sphingobium sp.]|nr:rod shape-determining protein RodA [Sphingobium sp.]